MEECGKVGRQKIKLQKKRKRKQVVQNMLLGLLVLFLRHTWGQGLFSA